MGGVVSSYSQNANRLYDIEIQNDKGKTIKNCYKFKVKLAPYLGSYISNDGFSFIEKSVLDNDLNKESYNEGETDPRKLFYYYDTQIELDKDGSVKEKDVFNIIKKVNKVTVPADYCYSVDPPHPLLTPNCTQNNTILYIAIILTVVILISISISSSIFLIMNK